MIGQPRPAGRHRAGRPYTLVHRRLWDGPARDQAERLNQAHPEWVVLYGTGSRRFYAIAAWPAPEPVMVEDPTAEGLQDRMREAETAALLRRAASAPGPARVTSSSERARQRPHLSGARRRAVRPAGGLPYPPEGNAA
ncbi:hypothetical protein GCM10017673_18350 [Streptosporangium violaceochromogenes]|nr:hypothetical protein GCM10017673_18350 [Streptosporangium violaceochromogenes]